MNFYNIFAFISAIIIAFSPITLVIRENPQNLTNEIILEQVTEVTEEYTDSSEWFETDFLPIETIQTEPTEIQIPETQPETQPVIQETELDESIIWYSEYRCVKTEEVTKYVNEQEVDVDFLAKLLFAEAGISNWTGQVYVCSVILNLCDYNKISLWDAGHNASMFEVAPYVDKMEPPKEIYEVIDYVLNGGRIAEVCYFRTRHYHSFGTPICQIENLFFSKN